MPWELGFFDALKGKVAVLPIAQNNETSFRGTEYLGLYYYVRIDTIRGTQNNALWIYDVDEKYVIFDSWKNLGAIPTKRN